MPGRSSARWRPSSSPARHLLARILGLVPATPESAKTGSSWGGNVRLVTSPERTLSQRITDLLGRLEDVLALSVDDAERVAWVREKEALMEELLRDSAQSR